MKTDRRAHQVQSTLIWHVSGSKWDTFVAQTITTRPALLLLSLARFFFIALDQKKFKKTNINRLARFGPKFPMCQQIPFFGTSPLQTHELVSCKICTKMSSDDLATSNLSCCTTYLNKRIGRRRRPDAPTKRKTHLSGVSQAANTKHLWPTPSPPDQHCCCC